MKPTVRFHVSQRWPYLVLVSAVVFASATFLSAPAEAQHDGRIETTSRGVDRTSRTPESGTRRILIASDLDRPEAVAPISPEAVFVAERSGRLLLFDDGLRFDLGTVDVPEARIFYVPERPFTEGLKDIVAVPGLTDTVLWCATTGTAEAVRWTVGRTTIETTGTTVTATRSEIVWQSDAQPWTRSIPPPLSGCRMAIEDDDVVVAVGANGRRDSSGRVMRIALMGGRRPVVISTGHRNPSGIVFVEGDLWEVEHGPSGGDELNSITSGGDYGWPIVSAGQPDDDLHTSFVRDRAKSIVPVMTWTPAVAPSGITTAHGRLYVSGLKSQAVTEITVADGRVVAQRPIAQFDARLRDVRSGPDGRALWVLTDGVGAKLFKLKLQPETDHQ